MSTGNTFINSNGYLCVRIGGRIRTVHRLVASAFVPNPDPSVLLEVNHIDGNKTNNDPSNLEWVTSSQNSQHAFRNGLRRPSSLGKCGSKHHRSMAIEGYSNTKTVRFGSMREAERNGYSQARISLCVEDAQKTHKGLHWRRLELH